MPDLNPVNRQTLTLYKEIAIGDDFFLTVGKFKKTSLTTNDGVIGAQIVAFSPHTEIVEGGYINITVEPTIFENREDQGEENVYRYNIEQDGSSKPFRGIDSDNVQIPPTKYQESNQFKHPEGNEVAIVSSAEFYKQMENKFDLAQAAAKKKRRAEDVKNARQQEAFQEGVKVVIKRLFGKLRTEFSNYRMKLGQENSDFQNRIETDLQTAIDEGRLIAGTINSSDSAKVDISSGNYLEGTVERVYAGVTALSVPLNQTTYYQLEGGVLTTSTSGFSGGNFPIMKVVAGATEITSVTNYGAYQVPTILSDLVNSGYTNPTFNSDGKFTGFTENDGTVWTLTWNSSGALSTISDGTDTTTLNYNSDGQLTSIT